MLEWGETNTTSWLDACCGNHPRPTVQVGQFSYKIGYTLYPPQKKIEALDNFFGESEETMGQPNFQSNNPE